MANIRPFVAYRPRPEDVERVACPPYDVVSTEEARQLAGDHGDSFLHVTRPEIDHPPGTDEHSDAVYATGRKNLLDMVERKLLVPDLEPCLYVYAQKMGQHEQAGIVACAAVADYEADRIKKHEKTRPDKEDDRTKHILTLEAHDEPVFLTYRADPGIDAAVAKVMAGKPVYDFASADGVHHRLWVLPNDKSLALARQFDAAVGDLYVADGHHRSAAAARAHRELRGDGREHDVFLAVVFPHDQMNILAYNRVVKDRQGRDGDAIIAALKERMDVVSSDRKAPEVRGSFGVYVGNGRWYQATALPGSFDDGDPVGRLDCQICQDQILAPVFGITDPRRDESIGFVGGIHGAAELERRVDSGAATVAFYLYPTAMDQVMEVSDAGKVMPPKSTWFEPKLKSGLFVHTF